MVLADRCGLWKITSITEGEMIIEEELDENFTLSSLQKCNKLADGRAMDITTADLTSDQFRHAFMSKNRDWVIDQLQDILSPAVDSSKLSKAVRRRCEQDVRSDSEFEDGSEVRLSESSDKIMRIWLTQDREHPDAVRTFSCFRSLMKLRLECKGSRLSLCPKALQLHSWVGWRQLSNFAQIGSHH